jgi:hypothetical protein
MKLISHVNADSDLIEAWLKYYIRLGVDRFHLVVHGPPEENERLLAIRDAYPITIEDTYGGPFDSDQKKNRLDAVLTRNTDQWVVLVDSDEFVEFPYADIRKTIDNLRLASANVLMAPMLQRLKADGGMDTPPVIEDPFAVFPLCSEDLYERMGSSACISKCPLFFCEKGTQLEDEGNHTPPRGSGTRTSAMRGVTHHFKFRRTVSRRLDSRIHSEYQWRHESVVFRDYLSRHSNRLPVDGAFEYSREELFRRGLLRRLSLRNKIKSIGRKLKIVD